MVELRILGSPGLLGREGQDVRSVVHQPRRIALLSYLTLSACGTYLRRDKLLALFWPRSPEKKARSSLSEALSRLRTSLGEDVILTRGSDEVGVAADAIWCDVLELRRAVDESRWSAVAELYRGPLLDGLLLDGLPDFEQWLASQRSNLARTAVDSLGKLSDAAIAAGDDSARAWAERAFQLDPLDSSAARRLMLVLANSGHRAAALDLYDDFEARLRGERGMEASSETVDLMERIKGGWLHEESGFARESDVGGSTPPHLEEKGLRQSLYRETEAQDGSRHPPSAIRTQSVNRLTVGFGAATVVLAVALVWAGLRPPSIPALGVPTRAEVTGLNLAGGGKKLAISPDGRWLLATHTEEGSPRSLHIRRSDDPEWRPLPNTEGASNPTFSPDGRSVAFGAEGGIRSVPITGGTALTIAEQGDHPHWGLDDTVVYIHNGALYRVAASGGDPQVLLDSDTLFARQPHLLPNGKAVVFSTRTGGDPLRARILLLEIETGEVRELVASGNQPYYVPTGHLLYGHGGGALMGVAFDPEALRTTSAPETLLPDLTVNAAGYSVFAVSESGTLIYGSPDVGPSGSAALVWVGLDGAETPIPVPVAKPRTPRVSPDGGRIAYESDQHIWVYDVESGANSQLTFEGRNITPLWSRDGRFVYFLSERPGTEGLDGFRQAADGSTEADQLWTGSEEAALTSIAPDEDWLVVGEETRDQGLNVALVSLGHDGGLFREYLADDWLEYEGAISPDGRWMAYSSDELSTPQDVFVRDFPEGEGRWRVSESAGHEPVWSPDGTALYFVSNANLMRVDVSTEGTLAFGPPKRLFPFLYDPAGAANIGHDVHPDGDRFVAVRGGGEVVGAGHLITNWFGDLERLIPNRTR